MYTKLDNQKVKQSQKVLRGGIAGINHAYYSFTVKIFSWTVCCNNSEASSDIILLWVQHNVVYHNIYILQFEGITNCI